MIGLFNFSLSSALFLALAQEDATTLARHIRDTPTPPGLCPGFNVVRSHDELNLSRLPDNEREAAMGAYSQDPDVRIFDRGIRRRTPTMLGGDKERMRLMYSLLLALPGAPVPWYGEEIGMGDELSLEHRMAVRTPMQWSDNASAVFSTAARPRTWSASPAGSGWSPSQTPTGTGH